jgi:hypothetical protein
MTDYLDLAKKTADEEENSKGLITPEDIIALATIAQAVELRRIADALENLSWCVDGERHIRYLRIHNLEY